MSVTVQRAVALSLLNLSNDIWGGIEAHSKITVLKLRFKNRRIVQSRNSKKTIDSFGEFLEALSPKMSFLHKNQA